MALERRSIAAGITLAVLFAREVEALEPGVAPDQYVRRQWWTSQGLPQNTVQALAQTSSGLLWVGTQSGLARFDGASFETFEAPSTGLPCNDITALVAGEGDQLWIGTARGLVSATGPGLAELQRYGPDEGLPVGPISALGRDPSGAVWVALRTGGVFRLTRAPDPLRFEKPLREDVSGVGWGFYFEGPDEAFTTWLATSRGLLRVRGEHARIFSVDAGLPSRFTSSVLRDRRGDLWVATRGGVARAPRGAERFVAVSPTVPAGQPTLSLALDADGHVWGASFERGGWRYDGRRFETLKVSPSGIASVLTILESDDGSLWLGTYGRGLIQLREGLGLVYGEAHGLPDPHVTAIAVDEDRVVVGSATGRLGWLEDEAYVDVDVPSPSLIWSLLVRRDGTLVVGTLDGQLLSVPRDERRAEVLLRRQTRTPISALMEDAQGRVWVGAKGLFWLREGPGPARLDPVQGVEQGAMTLLRARPGGGAWVGTRTGRLHSLGPNGEVHEHIDLSDGLGPVFPVDIKESIYGESLVGTIGSGLGRIDGSHQVWLSGADGLPESDVQSLLVDEEGGLWWSGKRYLAWLPDALAPSRPEWGEIRCFRLDTLRPGLELEGGYQRAGVRDERGVFWLASTQGVVSVDPAQVARRSRGERLPSVTVEKVLANRQVLRRESEGLPPGLYDLSFQLSAPYFKRPAELRFQARLEGLSEAWTSLESGRTVTYPQLGPGRYVFAARVGLGDGRWSPPSPAVEFQIRSSFWETTWFRGLLVMAGGAGLWGLGRARHARREAILRAVVRERARISLDIHDSLAQGFAIILIRLGMMESTAGSEAREWLDEHLTALRKVAHMSLAEARALINGLHPPSIVEPTTRSCLESALQPLAQAADLRLVVACSPELPDLPRSLLAVVLRVAQEATTNAIRHAQCSEIRVSVEPRARGLRLRIVDDGAGYDPAGSASGHGTRAMRERVASCRGRLQVTSVPGQGATVDVFIPLHRPRWPLGASTHA
ncbi:MAG: two-component regulator propeller domain-containing protein [Myxococcota bacterium]